MPPSPLAWSRSPLTASLMLPHRPHHRTSMSTSIMILFEGNYLKLHPECGVKAQNSLLVLVILFLCYTGLLPRPRRQIAFYQTIWQLFNSIDFGGTAAFFFLKMGFGSGDFRLIACQFRGKRSTNEIRVSAVTS